MQVPWSYPSTAEASKIVVDNTRAEQLLHKLLSRAEIRREGLITQFVPIDDTPLNFMTFLLGEPADLREFFNLYWHWHRSGHITRLVRNVLPGGGAMDIHLLGLDFGMTLNRDVSPPAGADVSFWARDVCMLRLRLQGAIDESWPGHHHEINRTSCSFLHYGSGMKTSFQIPEKHPVSSISLLFREEYLRERLHPDYQGLVQILSDKGQALEPEARMTSVPVTSELFDTSGIMFDLSEDDPMYPARIEAYAHLLLAAAMKSLRAGAVTGVEGVRLRESDMRQLAAVKARIDADFAQPLTRDELASWAGVNRTKLSEGFRVMFGATLHDYLVDCRMNAARALLLQGIPVADVAERVGYQDRGSFSKLFKRLHGVSPSDYQL